MQILFADAAEMFATSPAHGLLQMTWYSPGEPVDCRLCQTATTPRDTYLLREIPFEDVDCAVYVGIHFGATVFADMETSMHTAGLVYGVTTGLARVALV